MVTIALLERSNQPRMETVVPRAISDVGDARQELGIQRDARCLHAEVIKSSNRLSGFHPADVDRLAHRWRSGRHQVRRVMSVVLANVSVRSIEQLLVLMEPILEQRLA